jgi:hypothetical protein
MELDELKQVWKETPLQNKPNTNIMELIQHTSYGPLAALKRTYRKQMAAMIVIPLLLLIVNQQDMHKVLSSVLFWCYVAFCTGVTLFAYYNYRIVKNMQAMDVSVKANFEQQIALLEKRAGLELVGLRCVLLFFALLLEVVPYFQHYRMLDKWHALPLWVRLGAYGGLLLLQYFLNKRIKQRRVGRHLAYLKNVVSQMH